MGCCASSEGQPPSGMGAFPAPLPPPMQDNMNELLNRWRHGEVNLLQRRFRLARAQSVKPTMATKLMGNLGTPSAGSGTATSATTSNNRDTSFGEDGGTPPASGENASLGDGEQRKQAGDGTLLGAKAGAGSAESGEVGGGSSRAGMNKEAFFRVFPDVQSLPPDVQKSAFRLFDCVGRGGLDFRNFCRALALCCRGSRDERLRFLYDLFSGPSQAKYYGTGADTGPKDAPETTSASVISEAELGVLKKYLGLSPADADPRPFQTQVAKAAGPAVQAVGEGKPASKGLQLFEYFAWAEAHVSDSALDKALRPFYLLPSPQQEKDKILSHLAEYHMQEGQWMCLVAAPWWAYWSSYAGLTRQDLERVPERRALGIAKAAELNASQLSSATAGKIWGAMGAASPPKGLSGLSGQAVESVDRILADGAGGHVGANGLAGDAEGGGEVGLRVKGREVPAVLARRPHEMDNSILQGGAEWEVAPNQHLGAHYILLPKLVWDVMADWYGGGPVFCRQVVRIASSYPQLGLADIATPVDPAVDATTPVGSLTVDLYPLALHVNMCDASGHVGSRERLMLESHYVTVGEMLAHALASPRLKSFQRGMTSVGAPPTPSQEGTTHANGEGEGDEDDKDRDDTGDKGQWAAETPAESGEDEVLESRLWVLEISPTGLIDTPRPSNVSTPGSSCRPRFSFLGDGMVGGMDAPTGVSHWIMVKPEEERMTLSELGLQGGEKVMVETRLLDGSWPRRRYIEDPGFRHFREGARVDAMDYQGRWFRGEVVEVQHRSSSRIIDSEGPVGKTSKNRRSRAHQSVEEDQASTLSSGSSLQKQQRQQQNGGDGSGGRSSSREAGGGSSRKRMRVRVRFDRFAPQWDEWYDSKSLKLAAEASHTAPAMPAQAVLTAGEGEDGTGEVEGDEELSPNPPSVKSGAPSNASSNLSRQGNGTFQPPVGRFPGEGGQWTSEQPRSANGSASRTQASGGADGLSNYVGGTLNRRSNTPGRPPVAGACGLVNLGNTCYLNSAVQCLSHTPLVRAYLLSDMWAAEVNKYNPLGTQGKLVEEFAQLLKSLWSQDFLCIYPRKFRAGLVKYKPQFSGNEQQDSQEFLNEMLDALHEDVNRVIDKPYVAAPDDDETESGKSDRQLADEAWDRHVQRNRSVIVDLFYGQLKMECRCPVCNKKSVTFDPFMCLQVPIPIRNDKMVTVVLLPRIRTRDIVGSTTGGDASTRTADGEAVEFSNPRQLVPVRYGMMLPRLGEVDDLKRKLSALCGLEPSALVVSSMPQHHHQARMLDNKEPLTCVRDDDVILAFAVASRASKVDKRASPRVSDVAAAAAPLAPTGEQARSAAGDSTIAAAVPGALSSVERTAPPASVSVPVANGTHHGPVETSYSVEDVTVVVGGSNGNGHCDGARDTAETPTGLACDAEVNGGGSGSEDEEDTDLDDDDRPANSQMDRRSPDERCMGRLPSKLEEVEIGWRLDALDYQGNWFPATVVDIDHHGKRSRRDGRSLSSNRSPPSPSRRRTELLLTVHFDNYTSKVDEQYGEQEWRDNKLAPLYSQTTAVERLLEVPVVHSRTHRAAAASVRNSSRDGAYELVHEGDGSVRSTREHQGVGYVKEKHLFGLPFHVQCPSLASARYLWRLVVQQASRFVAASSGSRNFKAGMGDKMAKAAAGASKRPHVTAAWIARAVVGLESGISDDRLADLLPFTIKIVPKQNPLSDAGAMELRPDRWRTASSVLCSKLTIALEWKDGGRDYFNIRARIYNHPSCVELENNAHSVLSGLTLEQCLDAYTREETLEEEDSWYCSTCQAHRRGITKTELWKMPDVLVIHIKRFQCSARWREKIRTLVVFPHSGLDMSGFVSSNSAHKNQAGGGQGGMVYDLYGVLNHMGGGMAGGHYTACCRSSPCSKDGVEEVTGWGLEHPWLHFDDEFVEEWAPDKIVSEAAYVLFYRRRRLTPSNVINMTI